MADVISFGDALKAVNKEKQFPAIYWDYDDKYITAYTDKKKKNYIYYIEKTRCKTRKQRHQWILQVSSKLWSDGWEFQRIFDKALKYWKY